MMEYILPCVYSFFACLAVGMVFNLQKDHLIIAAVDGAFGWAAYLFSHYFIANDIICYFISGVAIALFAEVLARVCKCPVSSFLTVSIIPTVPGGGMYYTMEYFIRGDIAMFSTTGLRTLSIAGAIALGIVMVASVVRLWKTMQRPTYFHPWTEHK
ncbi:MAG: threonine/serine exporter family protein [Peptococcaceae bacterium]|nr:threonine/serine exporter family protein [Peptococcaceae bacterium]